MGMFRSSEKRGRSNTSEKGSSPDFGPVCDGGKGGREGEESVARTRVSGTRAIGMSGAVEEDDIYDSRERRMYGREGKGKDGMSRRGGEEMGRRWAEKGQRWGSAVRRSAGMTTFWKP